MGNVQYVIVQHATDDGDQGFEFDNNGDENTSLPRSNPTISNFTLIGQRASAASDTGMLLREGTAGTLRNGIVVDFEGDCLDVDQSETFTQATSGALSVASVFFDCTPNASDDADGFSEADFIAGTGFAANVGNVEGDATGLLGGFSFITDMTNNRAKGVVPQGALGVTPIDPSAIDPFLDAATYVGAVENGSDTWYQGWTLQQQ